MRDGEEFERHGFNLLAKRPRPEEYFDALAEAGFFDPSRNPGPVESTKPGFVHVPFWTALTYLEVVARRAGELNDLVLANKVMKIVREVTNFRDQDKKRDNHYTYWKFAELYAILPTQSISNDDVYLVADWISSKFDRGMVASTLGRSVIGRFLNSGRVEDVEKACILLEQCTAFEWPVDERRGRDLESLIDDFWLKELIKLHGNGFGKKAGRRAAGIFAQRLSAIFSDSRRAFGSSAWRAAIEDSPQNHDFRGVENNFVEGFRDVLAGWIEVSPDEVRSYIDEALGDQVEIIRRVALHTVNENFPILQPVFEPRITGALFTAGHRHELYRLLRAHFSSFSETAKASVIASLQSLPEPRGDDSERRLKRTQQDWLTAIKDAGYAPADEWFGALAGDQSLGPPSEHPDFLMYHEMRWGPGPTPFGADALVAFAKDGTIVEKLNAFQEGDPWRGPTLGGLLQALEAAVVSAPNEFLPLLGVFRAAKLEFQHAVLNGFKRLLAPSEASASKLDWSDVWSQLMTYFRQTINDEGFWGGTPAIKPNMIPNRDWMVSLIADFLQAGTRNDDSGYPAALLPQGLEILRVLLARVRSDGPPGTNDATTHAMNTTKGRVLEALINHALRGCRLAFREGRSVSESWASICDLFDAEVEQCRNDNFEFSTLAAVYIANIEFMSAPWLSEKVDQIFPIAYAVNFQCAIGGLAFATPTLGIFRLLSSHDVFKRALAEAGLDSRSRERLIEWICLAYLWGEHELNSEIFTYLFDCKCNADDLRTASFFFWRLRGEGLDEERIEKILQFWAACIEWAKDQKKPPILLLSSLSQLSSYFKTLDDRNKDLLLAVAPFVHSDYNMDGLIEELSRFVDSNPAGTVEVLHHMLETSTPDYDFEKRLETLIRKLASLDHRGDAIRFTEMLRGKLPGMLELYKELTSH